MLDKIKNLISLAFQWIFSKRNLDSFDFFIKLTGFAVAIVTLLRYFYNKPEVQFRLEKPVVVDDMTHFYREISNKSKMDKCLRKPFPKDAVFPVKNQSNNIVRWIHFLNNPTLEHNKRVPEPPTLYYIDDPEQEQQYEYLEAKYKAGYGRELKNLLLEEIEKTKFTDAASFGAWLQYNGVDIHSNPELGYAFPGDPIYDCIEQLSDRESKTNAYLLLQKVRVFWNPVTLTNSSKHENKSYFLQVKSPWVKALPEPLIAAMGGNILSNTKWDIRMKFTEMEKNSEKTIVIQSWYRPLIKENVKIEETLGSIISWSLLKIVFTLTVVVSVLHRIFHS
ncbi:MAG: hypothetical protein HYT79_11300 [Elusimicrobia bacterium]|nr:hypothetical protein [Elusimicrobiota bacterium]